jgi:phosphoserine phosphatase RsbU/P
MKHDLYKGSLALRVLAVSIIVFTLPMLIYFMVFFRQSYDQRLLYTTLRLNDLGTSRALQLSQLIKFNQRTLNILTETLGVYFRLSQPTSLEEQAKEINPILEEVANGGDFSAVFFLSLLPGGRAICTFSSDPNMIGHDYSSLPLTEEVLKTGYASIVAYSSASFDKLLYTGKLIYSPSTHKPIGILGCSMSVTQLISELLKSETVPYPVNFSLITKDNVIFASGDPDLVFRTLRFADDLKSTHVSEEGQIQPVARGDIWVHSVNKVPDALVIEGKGRRAIAIIVPIAGSDFSLLLDADEKTVYSDLYAHLLHVLGIFFVLIAVGGWAALWLTQRMSRPLNRLTDVMNRVSRGDLSARFEPDNMGFEINSIGEIFNSTLRSLRHQMRCFETERVQKETLKRELNIGQEIQMSILPHEWPAFPGVELAARYVPAKEVGGDFYDLFTKDRVGSDVQDLVLAVADASGKGISACLYSLCVRSMLRSFCVDHDNVGAIMARTNDLFCQDTGSTGVFVTAFIAIYEPDRRLLRYTSAGHNPALVRRKDGRVEPLTTSGMAMGVEPILDREIEERSVQLETGDVVLFYTDGIPEAHNAYNELFGGQRLAKFLVEQEGVSANKTADRLLEEVRSFAQGSPQHDDITIMVLRIL